MIEIIADLKLAQRNVLRQWRRSAFALSAIACGVAGLLLASGFIEWNFMFYRETMIKSQLGHLRVHKVGFTDNGHADPYAYLMDTRSPVFSKIRSLPYVRSVAPRIAISGLVSRADATLPFIAEGVDPASEIDIAESVVITEGTPLVQSDVNGVIVGQGLASNLGAIVGDRIVLMANTEHGGINAAEVEIRGVFATVSKAYDDVALRMHIKAAQQLVRVNGAHSWVVFLDRTERTLEAVRDLGGVLDASKYEVIPWWELSDFYNKSAALFAKQVGFMKSIIGLLIVLLISNTLMMSVLARTGEIGTSMALGVTRSTVLRRFLAEGLVLALVGTLLGCAAGVVLAKVISTVGIPVPPPPGMGRGYTGQILVTIEMAFGAAMLAIGTTLAASAYPAWKASRMVIVDALRHNRA